MVKPSENYARLHIGAKQYADALLDLQYYEKLEHRGFRNKEFIIQAIINNDIPVIREISRYFYKTNGIYQKVVNYFANMYRFDWYMVPELLVDNYKEEKVIADFQKKLNFMDASHIKKICGEFTLKVIRDGVCYGYIAEGTNGFYIQDLPWKWCRSRFKIKGVPAIEFNMQFFDTVFPDVSYRMKVLDLFPPEFKKGYRLYKEHKLPPNYPIIDNQLVTWGSWYLLDPGLAFKFSIMGLNEMPLFINAVPSLIDLDTTQGIDRKRQLQQLLKIIIQKLPLDKNGDLIFDVDEARDIHNNAVEMLRNSIGVDVLTTFADVDSIEVSDSVDASTNGSLDNAERTVYNNLGTSKNIFNTNTNLALEKSILADEGSIRDLILQYENFFDRIAQALSENKKKWNFRFYMLHTTQYNYQALSKLYKEQTQLGFSKMLPQIALGQSQSFILNTVLFENDVMHLSEVMIPPLMSSTLNVEDVKAIGSGNVKSNSSDSTGGRPAKDTDELSDKTIKNKESMN